MVKALTDTKLKAEVHFKKMNVFLIKLSNLHPIYHRDTYSQYNIKKAATNVYLQQPSSNI